VSSRTAALSNIWTVPCSRNPRDSPAASMNATTLSPVLENKPVDATTLSAKRMVRPLESLTTTISRRRLGATLVITRRASVAPTSRGLPCALEGRHVPTERGGIESALKYVASCATRRVATTSPKETIGHTIAGTVRRSSMVFNTRNSIASRCLTDSSFAGTGRAGLGSCRLSRTRTPIKRPGIQRHEKQPRNTGNGECGRAAGASVDVHSSDARCLERSPRNQRW